MDLLTQEAPTAKLYQETLKRYRETVRLLCDKCHSDDIEYQCGRYGQLGAVPEVGTITSDQPSIFMTNAIMPTGLIAECRKCHFSVDYHITAFV